MAAAAATQWKTMPAKYAGKCARCRERIAPGDQIEWNRLTGAVRHAVCSPSAVAAAKAAREAEAAAREAEAARWVPPGARRRVALAAIMAAEQAGRAAVDDPSACRVVVAAEGVSGTEGPWMVIVPLRDGGAPVRVRVTRGANGVGSRAELP